MTDTSLFDLPRPPAERPATKPVAWIFGGGITGLSAAHELIERGFEVHLVEPARDPLRPALPAVGGVARSQWALLPPEGEEKRGGIASTIPLTALPSFAFGAAQEALTSAQRAELVSFARRVARQDRPPSRLTCRERVADDGVAPGVRAALVASMLRAALRDGGAAQVAVEAEVVAGVKGDAAEVAVVPEHGGVVPGEHGFRYFPGFYRHVFDTMRRIPRGERTVYEGLVHTEAMWMVVDRAGEKRTLRFPRTRPRSLQELFDQNRAMLAEVGYSPADLARLTLKLFQYMTTSTERREAEFEDATWWDFIEGERFSPRCREHLDRGPEVLGAMTARESDARTQGNCVVQLLIDQLLGRPLTDATLDAPTSTAWFDPWREHLVAQGVRFHVGSLAGFRAPPDDPTRWLPGVLLPRVEVEGDELPPETFATAARAHAFVLALPAAAMLGLAEFLPPGAPEEGVAERFLTAHRALGATDERTGEVGDFERAAAWARAIREAREGVVTERGGDVAARRAVAAQGAGPLRHLSGVQYFFPNAVQTGQEHTLYMDSAWRLSSISQLPFWTQRAFAGGRCRGIVSVDIGAFHRPHERAQGARVAWSCGPEEIALRTWSQVAGASRVRAEDALAFHLDTSLVFGDDGVERNLAPYLINAPGDWRRRPGRLAREGYALQNGAWALAGTYMKTFTRLTTMESANESARHAVNAILDALQIPGDRCRVWDPEDHEIDDLATLRAIDARLFREGYPHMIEILGLDELPGWIFPEPSGAHDRPRAVDGLPNPLGVFVVDGR